MSEEPTSNPVQDHGPSWHDIADNIHDYHEALQPHIERNLAARSINATITHDSLQRTAETLEPEQNPKRLKSLLTGMDTVQKKSYINQYVDYLNSSSQKDDTPEHFKYSQLFYALEDCTTSELAELYFPTEDDNRTPLKQAMLSSAQSKLPNLHMTHLLKNLYGLQDLLTIKSDVGEHTPDEVVQALCDHPDLATILSDDFAVSVRERPTPASAAEKTEATVQALDWQDRYLEHIVGMPADIRDDYSFASHGRMLDGDTEYIDPEAVLLGCSKIADRLKDFSTHDIARIYDKAGIVNFDYYSKPQLERVLRTLDGDPKTVQDLRAGDVTVVLNDARGDHNGALGNNWELYETPYGRSLFFEINRPSDFYRHMAALRRQGIKPSTLVISAHGRPGEMLFGKDQGNFTVSISQRGTTMDSNYSINDAGSLPRLVGEYMQDSRGIDDDEDSAGRRRIVLASCSQAEKDWVQYRNHAENSFDLIKMSTAETLAEHISRFDTDVYAGAAPVRLVPTKTGYRMEELDDTNESWKPHSAVHVYAGKSGRIYEEMVDEVVLYSNRKPS